MLCEINDCIEASPKQLDKMQAGLKFLGVDAPPEDCDVCEDGSVWYGLVQILPRGGIVLE